MNFVNLHPVTQKTILLIITGSIAAYKSLELIRRLRERNVRVNCILTAGGQQFITPLSVASLSGQPVYTDLFSLKDETEMGHIRLSREADLVLVAPASADIIAKMVAGRADDLATTALLATDKPVMIAPAMNSKMWDHPATQRNVKQLQKDGIIVLAPGEGDLACGEVGSGRMEEVEGILEALDSYWQANRSLLGMKALVTSGPTIEPIDPVRFLSNRSSGKQGHAIAAALSDAGADVTLVSGPTALPDPAGVRMIHVETADAMWKACQAALPADIVVCAAAVADWKTAEPSERKLKKRSNQSAPTLSLQENPDILHSLSSLPKNRRPRLIIGFAAETDHVEKHAKEKLARKGCDWILANEVGQGKGFSEDDNSVILVTAAKSERWPRMSKRAVAAKLVQHITEYLKKPTRVKAV